MDHPSFAGSAGDNGHKLIKSIGIHLIKLPSNCTPEIANYYVHRYLHKNKHSKTYLLPEITVFGHNKLCS